MNSKQPHKNNIQKGVLINSTRQKVNVVFSQTIENSAKFTITINNRHFSTRKTGRRITASTFRSMISGGCYSRGSLNQDSNKRPKPNPPPSNLVPSTK